jgi:hypothetical protein
MLRKHINQLTALALGAAAPVALDAQSVLTNQAWAGSLYHDERGRHSTEITGDRWANAVVANGNRIMVGRPSVPPSPPLQVGLGSDPAAVSWGPNRIDVFAAGSDRALWHIWWDGRWSAWESLGGNLHGGPDVASWGPLRLDVYARSVTNELLHLAWEGRWFPWETFGGGFPSVTSDPSVVSWGPGRLDVFFRGPDGALWHVPIGQPQSAQSLGGQLAPGSGPDATSWGPGRLDVFVRGTDNALHNKWYDGNWSNWESRGGVLTSDPSAVSWGPLRIDVFARGTDNALHHLWFENGWRSWESLGGFLTSGPDASSWASGRLDVFVRGGDNALHHRWFENGWGGWEPLGAPGAQAAQAARGRYRVTLNGFTVNRQTVDNFLQLDGKADEVEVLQHYAHYTTVKPNEVEQRQWSGPEFGDVNGYSSRIRAGSAGSTGGLKTGDNHPAVSDPWVRRSAPDGQSIPRLIWQGDLIDGENVLLLNLAILEADRDNLTTGATIPFFLSFGDAGTPLEANASSLRASGQLKKMAETTTLNPLGLGLLAGKLEGDPVRSSTLPDGLTRPIGMTRVADYYSFQPVRMAFNYRSAEQALQTNPSGKGAGVLAVTYTDDPDLKGTYTLYVQVERVQ